MRIDQKELGRAISNYLKIGCDRAIYARARIGEDRFLDIPQHRLLQELMSVIEAVYSFLELELTSATRSAMEAWQKTNYRGEWRTPLHTGVVRPERQGNPQGVLPLYRALRDKDGIGAPVVAAPPHDRIAAPTVQEAGRACRAVSQNRFRHNVLSALEHPLISPFRGRRAISST